MARTRTRLGSALPVPADDDDHDDGRDEEGDDAGSEAVPVHGSGEVLGAISLYRLRAGTEEPDLAGACTIAGAAGAWLSRPAAVPQGSRRAGAYRRLTRG